jgi:hypothetical protein
MATPPLQGTGLSLLETQNIWSGQLKLLNQALNIDIVDIDSLSQTLSTLEDYTFLLSH